MSVARNMYARKVRIFSHLYAAIRRIVSIYFLYIKQWLQKVDSSNFPEIPILPWQNYIIFILFAYRKIALCHTTHVIGRAMEC